MFTTFHKIGERRNQVRHRLRFWLIRAFGCLLLGSMAPAGSQDIPEYRLKAAFLYNFAVFTEWPSETGSTLKLCIHGRDPFGAELDSLEGKKTGARTITLQRNVTVEAAKDCQIVFIASAAIGRLPAMSDAVRGLPVLLVAESPGAARQGAILNLSIEQSRVIFEANLEAARSARLTLSSRLLRLASEVIR